jgi:cytochrome b
MTGKVRVWDLPVRMFHWTLVVLVIVAWWSGEKGDAVLHRNAGLGVFALVLFRLFWGLAGSRTARFSQFVVKPGAVIAYLPKVADEHASDGHNPLGGWSVAGLLLALLVLAVTGLFAGGGDVDDAGPLAHLVAAASARAAAEVHEGALAVVAVLVGLHVSAIGFYQFMVGRNLIGPMITGQREREAGEVVEDVRWSPLRAALGLGAVVAIVWALSVR